MMKWNWGTKIALFYSSFVVFILFMVYLSSSQKYDLVTEDYYAAEINYQQTINSKTRTDKLSGKLYASLEDDNVTVHFPQKEQLLQGTIECFRPSDQNKDFKVDLHSNNGSFSIPLQQFASGKYLLKINWEVDQVNYYKELTVIIP